MNAPFLPIHKCLSLLALLIGATVFSQKQHIALSGYVKDTEGCPFENATVSISFNDVVLATTQSMNDGAYVLETDNWGQIQKMKISVMSKKARHNKSDEVDITVLTATHDFFLERITPPDWEREEIPAHWCYTPSYMYRSGYASYPGDMFRSPWGTFAYMKPDYFAPVIYHHKISQIITLTDAQGRAIRNARVEIKVPDDQSRWGLTDNNGQLTLHMQFDRGARQGTITLSAQGYHSKKLYLQSLDVYNKRSYRLKAKNG